VEDKAASINSGNNMARLVPPRNKLTTITAQGAGGGELSELGTSGRRRIYMLVSVPVAAATAAVVAVLGEMCNDFTACSVPSTPAVCTYTSIRPRTTYR